jgi:hypothetical protein
MLDTPSYKHILWESSDDVKTEPRADHHPNSSKYFSSYISRILIASAGDVFLFLPSWTANGTQRKTGSFRVEKNSKNRGRSRD